MCNEIRLDGLNSIANIKGRIRNISPLALDALDKHRFSQCNVFIGEYYREIVAIYMKTLPQYF